MNITNKKSLSVLSVTAALGIGVAALIYNQQSSESQTAVNTITETQETVISEQNTAPATKKIATVKATDTSKKTTPMTREEVVAKAQEELRARSDFAKRVEEKNRLAEVQLAKVSQLINKNPGYNASIQKHLNIDTKKTFGIDYDAKMAETQRKRQAQDSAELERRLVAMGATPQQMHTIQQFRQQVLNISKGTSE